MYINRGKKTQKIYNIIIYNNKTYLFIMYGSIIYILGSNWQVGQVGTSNKENIKFLKNKNKLNRLLS